MSFDEKNELNDFDFSKEIEMPEEMDTGAIAENIQSIADSSAGMEEMELYDDNSTKVMDAIPHTKGVISDLQLLPEDDTSTDIGLTRLMPDSDNYDLGELQDIVDGKESDPISLDDALSADVEEAGPEILQDDISLSGRAEEELGDLSYHDEDVETVRPHREHSAEHRRPEHRDGEHRRAEHRDGEHRRPEHRDGEHRRPEHKDGEHRRAEHKDTEHRSAEHKRPVKSSDVRHKSAEHSSSHKKFEDHASTKGYKGPRIEKEEKRKFGLFDMVLIGVGAVALIGVAIFLTVYLRKSSYNHKVENVAEIGEKLASLGGVGQTGIDGIIAHRTTATIDSITDDTESGPSVEISVNFSSMEKDLKIKFSDKVTDELITGVLFKVEAKSPDDKSLTWTDDDKDGIIYEENLKPGIYKVKIANVDKYKFPDKETDVTVKEKISYTAINIVNEIKKEKDINVALEDGRVNEIDTGVQLQDTVAWVNTASKTVYQEVAKTDVVEPVKKAGLSTTSRNAEPTPDPTSEEQNSEPASETTSEQTSEPASEPASEKASEQTSEETSEQTPEKKPITNATLNYQTATLTKGDKLELKVTPTPSDAPISDVSYVSSHPEIATVDKNGNVTAVAVGTAVITCKIIGRDNTDGPKTPSCTVTVIDAPYVKSIKLSQTTANMAVKATLELKATLDVSETTVSKEVIWSSSNQGYATVDNNGKVTAVTETPKGQSVTITCTTKANGKEGKPLTATCVITISGASTDTTTPLKDKSGNQVFVKDGDNFREAKSADYYKYSNFYIKKTVYNGWQTLNGKTMYYKADGTFVTGEQVIGGVKYNFANDGSLSMGGGTRGIDVSSWNGNIDWNAVKNSGVSFVIIRCGYRGYTQGGLIEDSKFHTYASGAEAAGLKVGVYFFSQATNEREAVEEASMAISMAKSHKISYPIFIDSEYGAANHNGRADRLDKATRTACVRAFCETVRSSGYTPGVYASKSWYYNNLDAGQLNNYKIWLAHYCAQTDYKGKYELWQSSNTGRINGISGNVDINTSYLGY